MKLSDPDLVKKYDSVDESRAHKQDSFADEIDRWGAAKFPRFFEPPQGHIANFGDPNFPEPQIETRPRGFGSLPADQVAAGAAQGPSQKDVDVNVTGQAEVTVAQTIKVEASEFFKALVDRVEKAIASIPLTSTGHAASQLGSSSPEAAAPSGPGTSGAGTD